MQRWPFITTLVLVLAGCTLGGSPPSPPTPSPAGVSSAATESPAPASDSIVPTGTCNPTFEGICSEVEVEVTLNVTYTPAIPCGPKTSGKTCQLAMDIAAPTSSGPWPLIVFLVGGSESPDERYPDFYGPFAEAVAGQGAVVMVTGWRVGARWGGGYPTSFEDVACAIGVARRIAPSYGADPARVSLVGSSNGGWPAVILGLTPHPFTPAPGSCDPTAGSLRPDNVVSMAGTVNYDSPDPDLMDFVTGFLGGDRDAIPNDWAGADEFGLVKRYPADDQAVPFLLIQGLLDLHTLPVDTRSFERTLEAAGYSSRLIEIPKMRHVETWTNGDAVAALASFVERETS